MLQEEAYIELLPNGIRLIFLPAEKFKTVSLALFIHQELRRDLAGLTALLPAVLERGSRRYPDSIALRQELEMLYGAGLSGDVHKKGENHLISFSLEMVHNKYVGEDQKLLNKGMEIMNSIAFEPLEEEGRFKEDYVSQEKDQLSREIRGLINDKNLYSLEKCLAVMCSDERFGVFKFGTVEDLEKIDPACLWQYYLATFSRNPVDLYLVGDLEPGRVLETAAQIFTYPRRPAPDTLPGTLIYKEVGQAKYEEEEMAVSQAKMVIGFRTNISFADPLYYPLLFYNGVLGSFPHSKLFLNVREKASLAYYVYSRLERHKGIMVIAAGIDGKNFEKAKQIIEQQIEEISAGKISDLEMENTRRGLLNQLHAQEDSPHQRINNHLDGSIGGKVDSIAEMGRRIEAVTLEDVVAAARQVKLDTVYLLRGQEEAIN